MLRYLLKRILFFIPTLFVISLVAFSLSVNSPVDPVDKLVNQTEEMAGMGQGAAAYNRTQEARQKIREQFNLHLPLFYFRVASLAEPDTFYRIYDRLQRRALGQLLDRCGNWEAVQGYQLALSQLAFTHKEVFLTLQNLPAEQQAERSGLLSRSSTLTRALQVFSRPEGIADRLQQMESLYGSDTLFVPLLNQLRLTQKAYDRLSQEKTLWKKYLPVLIIYGKENQYHKWVSAILLHLDFGLSYKNSQPISQRISELFFWSFMFTSLSIVLAYLIGLPLGVLGAAFHGRRFDRISTVSVFALDSVPSFVVAALLLTLFANPDILDWFPASFNVLSRKDQGLWATFWGDLNRLVLPLVAYTYGQVAFLSRLMRSSMLEVIHQDYIRTARAKGLREWAVLIRHAFRNAALPIVTSFAGVLPALIGGHVILETIFTIPGMGREIYSSIFDQDVPMIMAVFSLIGFMTILGFLVSDLLYTWVDPRIKLYKS